MIVCWNWLWYVIQPIAFSEFQDGAYPATGIWYLCTMNLQCTANVWREWTFEVYLRTVLLSLTLVLRLYTRQFTRNLVLLQVDKTNERDILSVEWNGIRKWRSCDAQARFIRHLNQNHVEHGKDLSAIQRDAFVVIKQRTQYLFIHSAIHWNKWNYRRQYRQCLTFTDSIGR